MNVSSDLKNLDAGSQWRGHVDGIDESGVLRGWALLAADPLAELDLDIHVLGIHLATIRADRPHSTIDRILRSPQPMTPGFAFDLGEVRGEGALELLSRHGELPWNGLAPGNLVVRIAGTTHALPQAKAGSEARTHLERADTAILRAAARQVRQQIRAGRDVGDLGSVERDILFETSALFSPRWYEDCYGDVAMTGLDPAEHFQRFGSKLGRAAGPWFETESYLAAAPAARAAKLDALTHYELDSHDTWWPGEGRFRAQAPGKADGRDHALLVHLYHLDTVPDLQDLVARFPPDTDLFISVPEGSPDHDPQRIAALFPSASEVFGVPNRGQDVAAFLETVRRLKGRGYRFFCKVHSKKGNTAPDTWRRVMFDALAATPERVAAIVEMFRADPRVLMAGPSQVWFDGPRFTQDSAGRLGALMERLGFGAGAALRDWAFFAGTCFWIDAELAARVAEVAPAELFDEAVVSPDGQTSHAVERLFALAAASAGGRIALLDGRDWTAPPEIHDPAAPSGLHPELGESPAPFLDRHFKALEAPRIVEGTARRLQDGSAHDLFGDLDGALHGAIDVLVSCWMSQAEPLHDGFAHLRTSLADRGLTSAFLVAASAPRARMQARSCGHVFLDSLMVVLPPHAGAPFGAPPGAGDEGGIPEAFALSLLRSECLFRKEAMPKGGDLTAALRRVERVAACWRRVLVRRKVKLFLIWGDTAPKSRLFIHLCEDLGIEYQIIERGHFPGTMSMDPEGQFGSGARPKLIEHPGTEQRDPAAIDARFDAIRAWYETQGDNAAYSGFQKHGSRDVEIMRQARSQGRPVILAIGGNDQGGGLTGPEPDRRRLTWFGGSDNAFAVIRKLVSRKFPDALLVLRPHPSQAPQEGEFVLVAREAALDDLIDAADVCISVGSTSRAICLLKEKPLLSLGLSELSGRDAGETIVDETHLLAALRRHVWAGFAEPYPDGGNRRIVTDLFDRHLIGIDDSVPTRHRMADLARLLAGRVETMKTGFLQDYAGREDKISEAMFEDVRGRGRAIFPVDPRAFAGRPRPRVSVVLPIYGDYEGTRICFDQLVRHQAENGYRVIVVWDRGPDMRLRDLCLEYSEKAGFTCLENHENVGFSGTVNSGILHAGRDDVILLNSDTIPCGDWALRLQDAAYAHPKIASVVPFSNNATIYNLPFPKGMRLPIEAPVEWAEDLDRRARKVQPHAVEMPVSHGYCTYVRRSAYDRLGLYSEMKFGIGQSEDNEFSLRARMAGYFCVCPTNVVMAHAGSTSFGTEIQKWLQNGRSVLRGEFSHYFAEIQHFFQVGDPLDRFRRQIVSYEDDVVQHETQAFIGKAIRKAGSKET